MTFAELATTMLMTATPVDGTAFDKNVLNIEIEQSIQSEMNVLEYKNRLEILSTDLEQIDKPKNGELSGQD